MTASQFTDTYLPLCDQLYRVAFYILESAPDAEDAVQDLYLKLWKCHDSLDNIVDNPKAYSMTLMRNMCIDRLRSAQYGQTVSVETLPETINSQAYSPTLDIERKDSVKELVEAMKYLSDMERQVLRLRVFQEHSYREIENITGLPNLTLRVLLSRAKKKIREHYENY